MRLIDADALGARMYHDAFETDSDMQKWDDGCWIRYKMFENAIADAPTIECNEENWINHGRWIWLDGVRCSNCNNKLQTTGLTSYCPNCGAIMEG